MNNDNENLILTIYKQKEILINELAEIKNTQKTKKDLYLNVFCEELKKLVDENRIRLKDSDTIVNIYENIKENMSQEEKDQFFLSVLDSFKTVIDTGRKDLRTIIMNHINRLKLLDKKRITNDSDNTDI